MLFNQTKQDKTCKFSRKTFFTSYVQPKEKKKNKQLMQLILCQLDVGGWRKEEDTRLTVKKNKQLIQFILCQLDVGGWQKEKDTRLFVFLLFLCFCLFVCLFVCIFCTLLEKEDVLENVHVLSCFA